MRITATITLEADAPDQADAWDIIRAVTTLAVVEMGRRQCHNCKPEIVRVTADGSVVRFQGRSRRKS